MPKSLHVFLTPIVLAFVSCGGSPSSPSSTVTTTTPSTTTTATVPAPTVVSIDPAIGSSDGGTPIEIAGTDFTSVTAVRFGSASALSFTVNSDTSISATAPGGAGTGDVTIIATAGISTTSDVDVFTWIPNTLTDFSLAAASVRAGTAMRGSVSLTFPAPSGGVSLPLSWDSSAGKSTAVIVPSIVTVPSGSTTGAFQITTFYTSSAEQIGLATDHGGVSKRATFSIAP